MFVLMAPSEIFMAIKTRNMEIGVAGARPCYWTGPSKSGRRMVSFCDTRIELDMATLVWTRGETFPLDHLAFRLKCPKCGLMKGRVYFKVPNQPNTNAVASR